MCVSCSRRSRRRKAKLDAGRVDRDTLRTKELLDAADVGKPRPRRDGPFTVTACPSPNAHTLALPRKMRCSPTVSVDRLKPFFARGSRAGIPGPGAGSRAGIRRGLPGHRLPGRYPTRGRRASTRRRCCSTTGWCAEHALEKLRVGGESGAAGCLCQCLTGRAGEKLNRRLVRGVARRLVLAGPRIRVRRRRVRLGEPAHCTPRRRGSACVQPNRLVTGVP